jgi:hypothetical protein
MNSLVPRTAGVIAFATDVIGVRFVVTLSVFFVGLFQDIHCLFFMGALNQPRRYDAWDRPPVYTELCHPDLAPLPCCLARHIVDSESSLRSRQCELVYLALDSTATGSGKLSFDHAT